MAASILIAYGADALEGYDSSATACSTADGGTQLDGGSGIYLVSMEIEEPEYGFFFASDDTEGGPSFYGDGPPTNQTHDFVAGDFVYVPAQTLTTAIGTILTLTAGWYEIVFLGEFAYGIYYNPSEDVLAQPTACAASEEINFTTASYAPNYLSASDTFTYGVIRSNATGAPLSVEIDISASSTAVEGIDYTRPSSAELTLSWASSTDGTQTFNVTTLTNTAYTASTFIPYIRSSSIADIVGTASYASSSIIYPGTLDFTSAGDTVNEGQSQETTITRSSGSDEAVTLVLTLTGTAVYGSDYTLTDLTKSGSEATASFGDGEDEYSFTINTIADPARTGSTLTFTMSEIEYPTSGTQFYVSAQMGTETAYILTINNYDTGSLEMVNLDGFNIYTASMPVTWSVDRYSGSGGPVTATIDLMVSGGYATGVFGTDYTGSSGSFPHTLTWDSGVSGSQTFSILTKRNDSATTAVSISPYISSASVNLETSVSTASAAWITYPGYAYIKDVGTSDGTVVEGGLYTLQYYRYQDFAEGGGTVGELTATLSFTGTAISGTDYTFPDASPPTPTVLNRVSWAPGDILNSFTIQTTDDAADEDNETIIVYLNSASGTIYKFFTTSSLGVVEARTTGFAFNTGSLIDTDPTYQTSSVTIIDNESGSVDFASVSSSVIQNSSLVIYVSRSGGRDFAATATIDQYSGTVTQNTEYSGLPATVSWDDQEQGEKTFTITTNDVWQTASAATLGIYFSSLTNIDTGTTIPTKEITITNTIYTQSANTNNDIDSDFTINYFKKMSDQRERRTEQVPFSEGIFGPASLRRRSSAYFAEMGAGTASKTS